jgi:hypothetical protein
MPVSGVIITCTKGCSEEVSSRISSINGIEVHGILRRHWGVSTRYNSDVPVLSSNVPCWDLSPLGCIEPHHRRQIHRVRYLTCTMAFYPSPRLVSILSPVYSISCTCGVNRHSLALKLRCTKVGRILALSHFLLKNECNFCIECILSGKNRRPPQCETRSISGFFGNKLKETGWMVLIIPVIAIGQAITGSTRTIEIVVRGIMHCPRSSPANQIKRSCATGLKNSSERIPGHSTPYRFRIRKYSIL